MHRLTAGEVFQSTRPSSENIRARDRSFIFPDLGVNLTPARYRLRPAQKGRVLPAHVVTKVRNFEGNRRIEDAGEKGGEGAKDM